MKSKTSPYQKVAVSLLLMFVLTSALSVVINSFLAHHHHQHEVITTKSSSSSHPEAQLPFEEKEKEKEGEDNLEERVAHFYSLSAIRCVSTWNISAITQRLTYFSSVRSCGNATHFPVYLATRSIRI